MTRDSVYRDDLSTSVVSLSYNFVAKEGTLRMPEGCCTDMMGAIALFVAIDPHVRVIFTVSGRTPDTIYQRRVGDDWGVRVPTKPVHMQQLEEEVAAIETDYRL